MAIQVSVAGGRRRPLTSALPVNQGRRVSGLAFSIELDQVGSLRKPRVLSKLQIASVNVIVKYQG